MHGRTQVDHSALRRFPHRVQTRSIAQRYVRSSLSAPPVSTSPSRPPVSTPSRRIDIGVQETYNLLEIYMKPLNVQ